MGRRLVLKSDTLLMPKRKTVPRNAKAAGRWPYGPRGAPRERSLYVGKNLATVYFVYVSATQSMKIGVTRQMGARLRNLQTGSSSRLQLISGFNVRKEHVFAIEKAIHKRFAALRTRGEWFAVNEDLYKFATSKPYRDSLPWWQSVLRQALHSDTPDPNLIDKVEKALVMWRPLAIRAGIGTGAVRKTIIWLMFEDGDIEEITLSSVTNKADKVLLGDFKRRFNGWGANLAVPATDDPLTCFLACLLVGVELGVQLVALRPGYTLRYDQDTLAAIDGKSKPSLLKSKSCKKNSSAVSYLGRLLQAAPSESSESESPTASQISRMGLSAEVSVDADWEGECSPSLPSTVGSGPNVSSAAGVGQPPTPLPDQLDGWAGGSPSIPAG